MILLCSNQVTLLCSIVEAEAAAEAEAANAGEISPKGLQIGDVVFSRSLSVFCFYMFDEVLDVMFFRTAGRVPFSIEPLDCRRGIAERTLAYI